MKNFLKLLVDNYHGIGNAKVELSHWFETQICNEIFDIRKNTKILRKAELDSIHQRLLITQSEKNRSPQVKGRTRLLMMTMQEEIFKMDREEEEKKSLEYIINNLLRDLPQVNNFDFTEVNTQEQILKALTAWKPQTALQSDFHKILLERLPLAMKKHGFHLICQDYKVHLKSQIANLMPSSYSPKPTPSKVEQFIAKNPNGIKNGSLLLNSAIQKYQAVNAMQQTLVEKGPVKNQLQQFKAVFQAKQTVLEPSRDNQAKKFCKRILDFLSAYQFSNWIWGTKGKETSQKIAQVSNFQASARG